MSGDAIKLSSGDNIEVPDDTFRLKNIEYLNTLRPNGLPRHNILKILMLLRNTNPREGICNRNRTVFDMTNNNKVLRCTIAATAKQVLILRVTFTPNKTENAHSCVAGAS